MPLGTKVGLSPCDSVLDWDPAPIRTKGMEPPPQLSAHFYCGQTSGCIKMPLGMEVDLNPGDFVLHGRWVLFQATLRYMGTQLPTPKNGERAPIFCSFWAAVCKTVRRMLSHRCLSVCLSVLSVLSCLSCPVCL